MPVATWWASERPVGSFSADVEDEPFADGNMREAYNGHFTKGKLKGRRLAGKVFKDSCVPGGAQRHHEFDRVIIGKATETVDRWNKREHTKKIWVNGHKVAKVSLGGRRVSMQVERWVDHFQKFNSNSGWYACGDSEWFEVAQVCRPVLRHRLPHRRAAPPKACLDPPPPPPLPGAPAA